MAREIDTLLCNVRTAIANYQPKLKAYVEHNCVVVEGMFDVQTRTEENCSFGILDSFEIQLKIPYNFPEGEPLLFETGGRIPKKDDMHVKPDDSCCFEVWVSWLARNETASPKDLLYGPIHDYFFSQYYFKRFKKWPFGDYAHGKLGIIQSFSDTLKCPVDEEKIERLLILFSESGPRLNWRCPCNSNKNIGRCCTNILSKQPISRQSARRMHRLFEKYKKKPLNTAK